VECLSAKRLALQRSPVIEVRSHFVLFDDAMVSVQNAKNLVQGFGIVRNPGGPPVEGLANTLWVLIMAGFTLYVLRVGRPPGSGENHPDG